MACWCNRRGKMHTHRRRTFSKEENVMQEQFDMFVVWKNDAMCKSVCGVIITQQFWLFLSLEGPPTHAIVDHRFTKFQSHQPINPNP